MKSFFTVLLVAAGLSVPLAALAQSPPPGPPPQMRAMMDQLHATAKTNAYNALTPDHRTQVQAIVAQVAAGTIGPRDASTKIDALLTPDEQKAVSAVEQKTFDDLHSAMAASGMPPPNGPPPGGPPPAAAGPPAGPPPGADARPYGSMKHGPPSPGRFLVMVSLTREQMRGMMRPQPAKSPSACASFRGAGS